MWNHLLKLIFRQWKSNCWMMAELFLSFVCLWAITNTLVNLLQSSWLDRGFDIDHVYIVTMASKPEDASNYDVQADDNQSILTLAERLRHYPGVEAVGLMDNMSAPYALSTNAGTIYRDTLSGLPALKGKMSPGAVKVFRYTPVNPSIDIVKEAEKGDVYLLSYSLMERLFGKGVTMGKFRWKKEQEDKEVGIQVTCDVGRNEYANEKELFAWQVMRDDARFLQKAKGNAFIYFRVSPEADHDFINRFWKEMKGHLEAGNRMIVNLLPMYKVRDQLLQTTGVDLYYTFGYFLAAFFLICTFLGTIGTFWFRTEARKSEIGLRMALGATRHQVRWQMIGEGLTLFTLVWIPGMVVAYVLKDAFEQSHFIQMSETMYFLLVSCLVTLFMILLIAAGIGYPARQASRVNPVDALRDE